MKKILLGVATVLVVALLLLVSFCGVADAAPPRARITVKISCEPNRQAAPGTEVLTFVINNTGDMPLSNVEIWGGFLVGYEVADSLLPGKGVVFVHNLYGLPVDTYYVRVTVTGTWWLGIEYTGLATATAKATFKVL